MTAPPAMIESVRTIAGVLRERPPQHWLLNRSASEIDQIGRRLHGLGIPNDLEIAEHLNGAIRALAAAHPFPEAERGELVGQAITHLDAIAACLTPAPPAVS